MMHDSVSIRLIFTFSDSRWEKKRSKIEGWKSLSERDLILIPNFYLSLSSQNIPIPWVELLE